jgi:hypothetical protein
LSILPAFTRLWFASLLIAAQALTGRAAEVDPRAEVATALYAASATQAASEQFADEKMRKQHAAIEHLQTQLRAAATDEKKIRAELTSAQETYVAELAARDRGLIRER